MLDQAKKTTYLIIGLIIILGLVFLSAQKKSNTAKNEAVQTQTETTDSPTPPPAIRAAPVTDSPATPTQTKEKTAETGSPAKTPAAPLDQKGKIEKIDLTANTFVVEGKTFTLSKHGKVFIDNTKMTLKDLKEGDLVAVVYYAQTDGTNRATRVIKGHPHKKKVAKSSE